MSKVLLVTDYSGNLHINPTGNKAYYDSRNKVNKTLQYQLKEMDEKDAEAFVQKNQGIDPNFKTPQQANKVIEEKEKELNELRSRLKEAENKDAEIAKLREQLKKASTAQTVDGAAAKAAVLKPGDDKDAEKAAKEAEKAAKEAAAKEAAANAAKN